MKKLNLKIWAGAMMMIFVTASCEDYLDVNKNPNQPTVADINLVLPQAIVSSAFAASGFNDYGAHFGGFQANAGNFSGFGILLSYNLVPTTYDAMWSRTYFDPLADLRYVIDKSEGVDEFAYFNAAAKIMTVVNFQRLVDAFGDIPYSQALQGIEYLAPQYDDAKTIYEDLIATLDEAIDIIDNAKIPLRLTKASDPLFGAAPSSSAERDIDEQMLDWKRYANTLKLRMLVRMSSTSDVSVGFASLDQALGFITDDVIVDPGYEKNNPNPAWNSWGRTMADALSNSSRVPTTFSFSFYGGTAPKIADPGRGETIFVNFPTTPTNQLGNEVGNPPIVAGQVTWASNEPGLEGTGVLKGPGMGQPLMLLAEANFLRSEAILKGLITTGNYETAFYEGITASFTYLYKDENESLKLPPSSNPAKPITIDSLVEVYTSPTGANAGNRLVIIGDATTPAERLEAIITQKYIALNMINSDEAWNEYRRTGFPRSVAGSPATDIASNKSTITSRPDRMPTRIMYPSSEQSYNSANYVVVDYTSDLIFWDPN